MTRPESNPLLQELVRNQQAPADFEGHLDADLLAAYAEDTLLPAERSGVLAHLAVCGECRQVLSVATTARPHDAEDTSVQPIPRPARARLWGWLPWVTTAAGIAAISSILLFHPQKRLPLATTSTSSTKAAQDGTAPGQRPEIPAEATQQAVVSVAPEAKARPEKPAPVSTEPPRVAPVQPTTDVAKNQGSEQSDGQRSLSTADAESSTALTAASQPIAGATAAKAASPSTTVQVANSMLPKTMNPEPGEALGGPVRAGSVARAFSGVGARPQWRINASGQVERSLGNGLWQEVLDAGTSKLRVVSVLGGSVWAGGDKLRLYRSTDNGVTWSAVQLPPKGDAANAITHVRFQTALDGKIDATDGSSWVTTDGGITWK
jgi:Putative zinc-finger